MLFILWLICASCFSMATAKVASAPPVLIWGINTPKPETIFRPMKTNEFVNLVKNTLKKNMIVVYFASELSAKDINCVPCFPFLRNVQPMNYYSQVEDPMMALQQVSDETSPITWHKPKIAEIDRLAEAMWIPCQKGRIHAFSFDDRSTQLHDNAMALSTSQFSTECPVVHIYTAFTEENKAYLRRKAHALLRSPALSSLTGDGQGQGKGQGQGQGQSQPQPVPNEFAGHVTYIKSSNMTILRHEALVFAFDSITLAIHISTGTLAMFHRYPMSLLPGNNSMQLGLYNDVDVLKGFVLVLDTDHGPLAIELLPVMGNWHITRAFCANRTFYPSDLIFFGSEFSLCCEDVTFFSGDHSLLSLFNFHLDIITSDKDNGMNAHYESKPCWSCSQFMSATLTQSLVVLLLFLLVLWIGMSFIMSIGRNKFVQVADEPDLHIKADL